MMKNVIISLNATFDNCKHLVNQINAKEFLDSKILIELLLINYNLDDFDEVIWEYLESTLSPEIMEKLDVNQLGYYLLFLSEGMNEEIIRSLGVTIDSIRFIDWVDDDVFISIKI